MHRIVILNRLQDNRIVRPVKIHTPSALKLNGGRHVQGILRGFDPFMNLVLDDSLEMGQGGQQNSIGMVVIRGNSIIMLEALERV
uniref:Small nuclear ribonucleoprotein G n=1 Tax=Scophthalmus maximus TaxID=52904 RepID=A0A8D3BYW4_SCOMX